MTRRHVVGLDPTRWKLRAGMLVIGITMAVLLVMVVYAAPAQVQEPTLLLDGAAVFVFEVDRTAEDCHVITCVAVVSQQGDVALSCGHPGKLVC